MEKSSRRSSILKLPKARQPFQAVEENGLTAEDSPMKLKRRVSFAEKKHVKEFCDSMEQGTVWDNTYEESELSNAKIHPTINTEDNAQIQVLSELSHPLNKISRQDAVDDNSSNVFSNYNQSKKVLTRQNAIDLDYLPIEAIHSGIKPGDIDNIIISENPVLLENKENIPAVLKLSRVDSSLIDDEQLTIHQNLPKNMQYSQAFSVYCDDNMDDESEDNTSLNKTDYHHVSMECTLPATNLILSPDVNNIVNEKCKATHLIGVSEKTQLYQDDSMEVTEAVSSIFSSKMKELSNKNSVFQNNSMEITKPVAPYCNIYAPKQLIIEDHTQLFHNNSMELTETVSSKRSEHVLVDGNEHFKSKLMKMSDNTSSVNLRQLLDNKTQLFHNNSMELTETISSKRSEHVLVDGNEHFKSKLMKMNLGQLSDSKTQGFHNKSMELTEVVSSIRPDRIFGHESENFKNKSMTMTADLPSLSLRHLSDDKTQCFHDKTMELTEVVSSIYPEKLFEDRTEIFLNKSMEMTEVVSSIHPDRVCDNETKIFNGKPMEITETVAVERFSKCPRPFTDDRTQLFHNKSMELTEPVIQTRFLPELIQQNYTERNQTLEKDLDVLHRVLHKNLNESREKFNSPTENSSNCQNQSMEMTAAVNAHFMTSKNLHESRTIQQNFSMEMTEVIPSIIDTDNSTQNNLGNSINLQSIHSIEQSPCNLSREIETSKIQKTTAKGNFDNSIEQLRDRANSVSKLSSDDEGTYEFTEPVCRKKVNSTATNILEDVEEPSFIFADISSEIPVLKMEKAVSTVPLPEISITEDFVNNQLDNIRMTYIINEEPGISTEIRECISESVNNESSDLMKTLSNEDIDAIQMEKIDKRTTVYAETNLHENIEICEDSSRNCGKRRTYVMDKDDDDEKFGQRKIIRSSEYIIKPVVNDSKYRSPSALIDKQFLQLNPNEKISISPVKKINFDFSAASENDLIVLRIENQTRILTATTAERNCKKIPVEESESNDIVCASVISQDSIKSDYGILINNLNEIAERDDCIWKVCAVSPNVISIEYYMTALILGVVFNVPEHSNELETIMRVRIVPRIADDDSAILRMTDRLIVQTIDVETLQKHYKTYQDVLPLIEFVTNEVNSIYDFYDELKRLRCLYSMKVFEDKVSFKMWSKKMDIILEISMNIKPFINIQPEDIDVICLLGSVRVEDVKNLIRNVKRNYKYLTQYIKDMKDYIDLMEESTASHI